MESPADLTCDHIVAVRMLIGDVSSYQDTLGEWSGRLGGIDELVVRVRHLNGPRVPEVLEQLQRVAEGLITAE